ncbi:MULTISPECIES: HAD family hydrolase [Halolamina]|uniref:Putative hydrolase of the HAD superfamily n=1 Tax=Halolamina pelagica TaxID=699431 RepID=A0A1I5NIP8_9EURY|nr:MULTISPECIES: HAD family hydrolase [Halolamina]NHX36333.1 HAD family hydrolase [Halolamina sp. R1-12]SFP21607.1 putative hydrolase of the HAD superfamily [Halolamina pelagica]
MTQIEAVLFDLDNTLVEYERSPGDVLQVAFDTIGSEPLFSVEEYYARYDEFAEKCDSMDELRSECFAALAAANGYERHRGRAVADAFSKERDQTRIELLPAVEDVLSELSREYRIGIVTNGAPDAQQQKIDAVNLTQWVDEIIVASHEVPPKPDPEPFERAMQSLNATPPSTIHVGDSPETDVAGATAAGIDSVLIADANESEQYSATHHIKSLDSLLSLPGTKGSASSIL